MDVIASVCHQHDIPSRQAMMCLLTMGWFLAHTSLAMTPEHSATNVENSSLRFAGAGHSKSMCLSSPKAQSPYTRLWRRQAQMAALLNRQQMRPHAKSQNPLQLCSAHGSFPVDWTDLMCRTRKPAAVRAQLHPRARAKSRAQGHSTKGCLLLHLKSR